MMAMMMDALSTLGLATFGVSFALTLAILEIRRRTAERPRLAMQKVEREAGQRARRTRRHGRI